MKPATLESARAARWLTAVLVLVAATTASPRADADPVRIQLRGGARLAVAAASTEDALVVRGELTDDAPTPIPKVKLALSVLSAANLPAPLACGEPGARAPKLAKQKSSSPGSNDYELETDDRGAFCLRIPALVALGAPVTVRFAGDKFHDAVEVREAVRALGDDGAMRAALRFEPALEAIDLDKPTFSATAIIRVERKTGGSGRVEGFAVTLEDERKIKLAAGVSAGDGKVRFEPKTSELAGPGNGELKLRFEGSAALPASEITTRVVRRAEARVALAKPVEPGVPSEGLRVQVSVQTARGPATGGVVEARRGGESLAAAPVENGSAELVVRFADQRPGTVPITVRYVPAAPFFVAGPELAVDLPVRAPSPLRQILLGALVLGVAVWVVAGWRRAPKRVEELPPEVQPPSGKPGVVIVAQPAGAVGWRGTVVDAHEGTPVVGAVVRIVVPSFGGPGVVAEAAVDERGAFTLEAEAPNGGRLVVEAPDHSAHEQALPPPSVLSVALVTRRRAVLDRLVKWSRRVGQPFDEAPEPTPGHVRRVASRKPDPVVEAWARKVEHAAFGLSPVDASLEAEVRGAEPDAELAQRAAGSSANTDGDADTRVG